MYSKHSLFHAFRATWPVMFGYIPLGLAFGVLFSQLGHAWHYATLMAITVYAGAAQFLAVGLLASGAGLLEIGIATLLLNARHIFYGLSLAPRFPKSGLPRLYLMFGLTDETYALLTSSNPPSPENATRFYVQVTALNQLYWVIGCTLGALLGAAFPLQADGLDFTLTALFVVLAVEQAYAIRDPRPFLIAGVSALIVLAVIDTEHMLLWAMAITTLTLLWNRKASA